MEIDIRGIDCRSCRSLPCSRLRGVNRSRREYRTSRFALLVRSLSSHRWLYFRSPRSRDLYQPATAPHWEAGLTLKQITSSDALVAAADNGDPTIFYYGERKGWHLLQQDGVYYGDPADGDSAISNLRQLREKGANYLVLTSNTMWWLDLYPDFREYVQTNSTLISASSRFEIYRLNPISK